MFPVNVLFFPMATIPFPTQTQLFGRSRLNDWCQSNDLCPFGILQWFIFRGWRFGASLPWHVLYPIFVVISAFSRLSGAAFLSGLLFKIRLSYSFSSSVKFHHIFDVFNNMPRGLLPESRLSHHGPNIIIFLSLGWTQNQGRQKISPSQNSIFPDHFPVLDHLQTFNHRRTWENWPWLFTISSGLWSHHNMKSS